MNGSEDLETNESIEVDASGEITTHDAPRSAVDWGRSVTAYIGEHPELCLAIALVLGAAIGVAVKRR